MRKHIALIFFLALAIVYTAYWFVAADQLEKRFLAWIDPTGKQFEAASIKTQGFPYRLWLKIEEPRYKPNSVQTKLITSEEWVIRSHPLDPGQIDFVLDKPHKVHTVGMGDHMPGDFVAVYTTEKGHASLRLGDNDLDALKISISGLKAREFEAKDAPSGDIPDDQPADFSIDNIEIKSAKPFRSRAAKSASPDDAIYVSVKGWQRQTDLMGILSKRIERLELKADLYGADSLVEFVTGLVRTRPQTLANWARAKGNIDVHTLDVEWGDIGLSLSGQLAVDRFGNLNGAVVTFVDGHENLINRLESLGLLDRANAFDTRRKLRTAAAVFGKNEDGATKIPLRLANGAAYLPMPVQPLRIFPLPPVF